MLGLYNIAIIEESKEKGAIVHLSFVTRQPNPQDGLIKIPSNNWVKIREEALKNPLFIISFVLEVGLKEFIYKKT